MGIIPSTFEFLLHEHRYRPIAGELLTIGKQSIPITPAKVLSMIEQYGLTPKSRTFAVDTLNQHRGTDALLDDQSFFSSFADCKVFSADISDYEGADFVFDLCGTVPPELRGRFQFILDGGTLDNIFDPFRMLANMTEMLAPGGRMFVYAWSNSHPTAYAKVSPDWLMDYFAVNEFEDCKVYPVRYPHLKTANLLKVVDVTVFQYDPYVVYDGQVGYECSSIFEDSPIQTHCIVEKGLATTSGRAAVQKHYRGTAVEPYLTSIKRFRASPRPVFSSPDSTSLEIPTISDFNTVRPIANWRLVR